MNPLIASRQNFSIIEHATFLGYSGSLATSDLAWLAGT